MYGRREVGKIGSVSFCKIRKGRDVEGNMKTSMIKEKVRRDITFVYNEEFLKIVLLK